VSLTDLTCHDCPAKINLFLEVRARRPDGFHEIDTVLQKICLFDTVSVRYEREPGIRLEVFGADLPTNGGNLVYRAAELFLNWSDMGGGVSLRLDKRIPVQAGLGGGSSDAAGTLHLLRTLLTPPAPDEKIAEWAEDLGSDVPFFLHAIRGRATGRGEIVETLEPDPPRWLVLFRPAFGLSTPDVYAHVVVPGSPRDVSSFLEDGRVFNRLEAAAVALDPRVGEFRERIAGHLCGEEHPVLTGSGSVFFVLVRNAHRAGELAASFNRGGDPARAFAVRTMA